MSLCCAKLGVGGALLSAALAPAASSGPLSLPFSSHSSRPSFVSPLSLQISTRTHAKRKPTSAPAPPVHDEQELDEDFRDSINQLSTDAVRAMLSDNMKRMEEVREKIFDLELYFEKEKEEDALLFVLVIRDLLDHRILPEAKQLKGSYMKAFQKICNIVEDSGWILKGDENEFGVKMADDELIPPTIMSEYR
eukprot:c20747_g1_i1 orf=138-716(+)